MFFDGSNMRIMSVTKVINTWLLWLSLATCSQIEAVAYKDKICVFVADQFISDAIVRTFKAEGYTNVVADDIALEQLQDFFIAERPDYVIVDGSGFHAPDKQLAYETKIAAFASFSHVKKLLLLSSFSLYPADQIQYNESLLAKKSPFSASTPDAIAKLSSFAKCRAVNDPEKPTHILCLYPYLFGPGDPRCTAGTTHPVYHIIDRVVAAKKETRDFTVICNDGSAQYDILYVDDFAKGLLSILNSSSLDEIINVSTGKDQNVETLKELIHELSEYRGDVILDSNCYDDVPRRLLNNYKIQELGWRQETSLRDALQRTISAYEKSLTQSK